jgi:hypothetical protein
VALVDGALTFLRACDAVPEAAKSRGATAARDIVP